MNTRRATVRVLVLAAILVACAREPYTVSAADSGRKPPPPSHEEPQMPDIISTLSGMVIFLLAGNPPVPIGTAFIVGYPHPTVENASIPLVVTAKHVVAGQDKIFGRFSTKKGTSTATVQYDLSDLRASNDYWEHPDEGVDIAVFRTPHFDQTAYVPLPLDLIAAKSTFKSEQIRPTDRVIFPALLVNFMGLSRNYPVIRDGSIALVPDENVPMKYRVAGRVITTAQELILIDATSIPGASGAPVFLWPGPRFRGNTFAIGGTRPLLLGVMHGFYPALPRELVRVETSEAREMFQENSGIAIVFPAWRLNEILELPELRHRILSLSGNQE